MENQNVNQIQGTNAANFLKKLQFDRVNLSYLANNYDMFAAEQESKVDGLLDFYNLEPSEGNPFHIQNQILILLDNTNTELKNTGWDLELGN